MSLTETVRELTVIRSELAAHLETSAATTSRLKGDIARLETSLAYASDGLNEDKIALARAVINIRGRFVDGGEKRESVRRDAINQLAAGEPGARDLWQVYFGTKSYDRWHGQRTDCEYGMGPTHGSIIFAVEVTPEARKRGQADLTPEEVEAAIYYLVNLERVQAAEKVGAAAA